MDNTMYLPADFMRGMKFENRTYIKVFVFCLFLVLSLSGHCEGNKDSSRETGILLSISENLSRIPANYKVSCIIDKRAFNQSYKVDFLKIGKRFYMESILVKGRPYRREGRKMVFYEPESPVKKICAFDGVRFQSFASNGSDSSTLRFGSKLTEKNYDEIFGILLKNPILNPSIMLASTLPISKKDIVKLHFGEIPIVDVQSGLMKFRRGEEFSVGSLDGKLTNLISTKWDEGSGFPNKIVVNRSDDSGIIWKALRTIDVLAGQETLNIPAEIRIESFRKNSKAKNSGDYDLKMVKDSFKLISEKDVSKNKFIIPTSIASTVYDWDLETVIKHP